MTDRPNLYLYEFLYRGRAPGAAAAPDYHVILAQDAADAFGRKSTSFSDALTPGQAKSLGFDIAAIVAAIDTTTMGERDALRAQIRDLEGERDAVQAKLDANEKARAPAGTDAARADRDPA